MRERSEYPSPRAGRRSAVVAVLGLLALLVPLLGFTAGAEEPVPVPPPGVVITVNGLPMTGGEGGKIASCAISVAVTGLAENPDPATALGVKITAVAPAVPEGSTLDLVTVADTTEATTWSRDFPMDDLVAPLTRHGNGYHLRVNVSIDGVLAGSSVYWLGCDQPQTGNPTRLLFAVQWKTNDGVIHDQAPAAVLAAGWQSSFRLDGTSKTGTAVCTYAPGATVLECVYDNPGHGTNPGLVVPGNPKATYDVAVTGVPAAWTPDATTLGTFVGRDTCPRGGGEGDEHVTLGNLTAKEDGGEGPFVCTHTVMLVQDPAPPTTTTTATTSQATTATTTQAVVEGAEITATLPATGSDSAGLVGLGVLLVATGILLVSGSARLRRRASAR